MMKELMMHLPEVIDEFYRTHQGEIELDLPSSSKPGNPELNVVTDFLWMFFDNLKNDDGFRLDPSYEGWIDLYISDINELLSVSKEKAVVCHLHMMLSSLIYIDLCYLSRGEALNAEAPHD